MLGVPNSKNNLFSCLRNQVQEVMVTHFSASLSTFSFEKLDFLLIHDIVPGLPNGRVNIWLILHNITAPVNFPLQHCRYARTLYSVLCIDTFQSNIICVVWAAGYLCILFIVVVVVVVVHDDFPSGFCVPESEVSIILYFVWSFIASEMLKGIAYNGDDVRLPCLAVGQREERQRDGARRRERESEDIEIKISVESS